MRVLRTSLFATKRCTLRFHRQVVLQCTPLVVARFLCRAAFRSRAIQGGSIACRIAAW